MKLIIYLLALFCFVSCDEKTKEESSQNIKTNVKTSFEEVKQFDLIKVIDYEGLKPYLARQNDTTYVVNFWATWCRPCIKELPYFEDLGTAYSDKKVKVILVSLDFPEKIESQVIPFIEKRGLKSELLLLDDADANGWIPKISEEWSGAIPATIIYNKNKRSFYERSFTYGELEKEVQSIL